jgi:hypothetical protein
MWPAKQKFLLNSADTLIMITTQPPHTEALPADTRLRKPQKPMPLGTIDCHAHIFDRFDTYPLAPSAKYRPQPSTREAWFALHDALGVARGVQVHGSPYGFDNTITEDSCASILSV